MRLTDRLLTETPRPALEDAPFTRFADMFRDPVVIDGTDVHELFMEMTMFDEDGGISTLDPSVDEQRVLKEKLGEDLGWQVHQFFTFDWRTVGNVAPPFGEFVIEVDVRRSMEQVSARHGVEVSQRDLASVGQTACGFGVFDRERWMETLADEIGEAEPSRFINRISGLDLPEIQQLPFRWMLLVVTFRSEPGFGLHGPMSTWVIPVDQDGALFVDPRDPSLIHAVAIGPTSSSMQESREYVLQQGFTVLIPALLAMSFMNTPAKTKSRDGYHALEEHEPPKDRVGRKYLERNFRPLTKWKVLNIDPLREALREAHGGRMPTNMAALKKALHIVRGHTATYMPNTYFGQKHDNPITVFRPSYRRGDARAGVVQKEYHLTCTGSET